MKMSDAFPSNYLRASDFPKPTLATIKFVRMEDIGDDHKPALYFNEFDKALILNKTNATTIVEAYGDDSDEWNGQPLVLFEATVQYQGRMVPAVRVRKPKPQVIPRVHQAPAPAPAPASTDMDDEIPF